MKRLGGKLLSVLVCVAWFGASPMAYAQAQVLTNLEITGPGIPNVAGWRFGSKGLSVAPTTPPPVSGDASYALEGQYPAVGPNGETSAYANYYLPSSLNDPESVYIDFWAKMPGTPGGLKFVKIFGKRDTSVNYADTTFLLDYTGVDPGGLLAVYFGDGTDETNDSQDMIRLNHVDSYLGSNNAQAVVLTPQDQYFSSSDWGTGWHHFLMHVRFNTNTDPTAQDPNPNGEIYLEIDGKVYVDVTDLSNRYIGAADGINGPIQYVQFFGWAQTDSQPFTIWYDNIVISTGGFVSDPAPAPMTNVRLQ